MTYLLLLTFILAPAYVVKFSLFGLPANLLMIWGFLFWVIFALWLIAKKQLSVFLTAVKNTDTKLLVLISLFFLSGIISLFVAGINRANLGQFIVLFLQPISLFFIAGFIFKEHPKAKRYLLLTAYCLLAISGIYAAIQYFTLLGLPPAWWGNSVEPKRALSFFVHPNFYALWCAPLLALLIPDLGERIKNWKLEIACPPTRPTKLQWSRKPWRRWGNWKFFIAWLLGALGLLLSLSRSGWLGLAAAVGVYVIVAADKKTRKIILGGAIVVLAIFLHYPNLRWRVILPFYGEKSADSRVELWDDGLKAVKQSPIFGLGLTGFAKEYAAINVDPTLDTHNFPHNIFLDLWVEAGLIGLISLIGLMGLYIYDGLKNRQEILKLAISLFLIALIFQGLVDNPYFKNDLALVFWIILPLAG